MTALALPSRHAAGFALLARIGYGARGLLYVVTGALAILASLEVRGASTGTGGALEAAANWPLGRLWLAAASVGLFCFAAWRVAQSLLDADRRGRSRKQLLVRAGKGFSALLHAGLGFTALGLFLSLGGVDEDASARRDAARLLDLPFGEWLLFGLAAAVLVAGAGNLLKAAKPDLGEALDCSDRAAACAVWAGRLGYAARGLVLVLLAVFLFSAARDHDASNARSVGGALEALETRPMGSTMVATLGVGFIAFGLYGLLQARFRRIRVPRP